MNASLSAVAALAIQHATLARVKKMLAART